MAGKSEHTPKGRALGAELRECRAAVGLTQQELAAQIGVSYVTISRYETGTRTPRPEDVAQILATLGVNGERYTKLVDMARDADSPNWLEAGGSGIRRELTTLIEFERDASHIVDVATNVVPGLLQTSDYARTIMAEMPAGDLDAHIAMRVGRRDVLTRSAPPEFTAIIAEAALRNQLGGPAVMADQLRHLQKMVELPNVTIAVLPLVSEAWHPAHAGAFILFEFPKAPPIVHLENYASTAFLYGEKDVSPYQDGIPTLRKAAMSPAHSAEVIADITDELEGATS